MVVRKRRGSVMCFVGVGCVYTEHQTHNKDKDNKKPPTKHRFFLKPPSFFPFVKEPASGIPFL